MRNNRKLLIKQLDQKLKPFKGTDKVIVPEKGWINTIRTALNITLSQLGKKLNITRQGARGVELSEAKGTISIKALREVGKALDLKFVYGFVPNDGTFENLINKKAKELAKKIVLRTHQNMALEKQGIDNDKINEAIKELAEDLKNEMKKSLWD